MLGLVGLAMAMAASSSSAQLADDDLQDDPQEQPQGDDMQDANAEVPEHENASPVAPDDASVDSPSNRQDAFDGPEDDSPVFAKVDSNDFKDDGDPSDDAISGTLKDNPLGMEWVTVERPEDSATSPANTGSDNSWATGQLPTMKLQPIKPSNDGVPTLYSAGGFVPDENEMPYMAELYWNSPKRFQNLPPGEARLARHACGGALIAKDWIVTAGHCVKQMYKDKNNPETFGKFWDPVDIEKGMSVRLGAEDIVQDVEMIYRIKKVIPHQNYQGGTAYDIALIQLVPDGRPRNPKEINTILPHKEPRIPDPTSVQSTGWGKVYLTGSVSATAKLHVLNLNTLSLDECKKGVGAKAAGNVTTGVICASGKAQKMCSGDSGSPLVLTNKRNPSEKPVIVGIVSWGINTSANCSGTGEPGVYTRVSAYSRWIEDTIKANSGL
jgi:hypothetical protein